MIAGLNCNSSAQMNITKADDLIYGFANTGSKGDYAYVRFEAGYSDDPASFDPTVIYLEANATCNFDGKYDAYKLLGNNIYMTNFYTFGCDSSKISINALPLPGDGPYRIRLGIKTERDADIIFRIRDLVGDFLYKSISILDAVTGKSQSLLHSKEYLVNLKAGHYQDRFYIILSNAINTEVMVSLAPENFKIFPSGGSLMVEINSPVTFPGLITIYNLMGQPLLQFEIQDNGYHEYNHTLECGIYIVTFRSGNRMISKKIFIQDS
jgi:hypothetical protein